jgi:hypothetical protein
LLNLNFIFYNGTQIFSDYYFFKLSNTFRLISGLGAKFSKRPTSISVDFIKNSNYLFS